MRIPEFLNRDDYLQNPILRRFLKDHRISFVENRADYIREIEAYSERDERSAAEVRDWLLHVIKEGSKEICYKKVRSINEWQKFRSYIRIAQGKPSLHTQTLLSVS